MPVAVRPTLEKRASASLRRAPFTTSGARGTFAHAPSSGVAASAAERWRKSRRFMLQLHLQCWQAKECARQERREERKGGHGRHGGALGRPPCPLFPPLRSSSRSCS